MTLKYTHQMKLMVSMIAMVLVSAGENAIAQNESKHTSETVMNMRAPQPKLKGRIAIGSLFHRFFVSRLAFSPDGRYLAIGDAGSATIVIWDVQHNKEQSRFQISHLADNRRGGPGHLHWYSHERLLWSPDGRFVTTGIGRAEGHGNDPLLPIEFWDPMTGKLAYALDAYSYTTGAFNRDGSKLLNISDGKFSIFDTRTWKNDHPMGAELWFDTGTPVTDGYGWTHDNKVLMVGVWRGPLKDSAHPDKERPLPLFAPGKIPPYFSMLIQKIDPSGRESPKMEVLADPVPTGDPRRPFQTAFSCHTMVTNFVAHKAAITCDRLRIIDTDTLQTLFTYLPPPGSKVDIRDWVTFSPDGRYLYLLANDIQNNEVQSRIIDASTGAEVGTFPSANSWGLTISQDGKTMAVGNRQYVELFELE